MEHITSEEWANTSEYAKAMAKNLVRKFPKHEGKLDDIVSEYHLCALRAAQQFDRSRGAKFTTFAGHFMFRHTKDWLRKQNTPRTVTLGPGRKAPLRTVSMSAPFMKDCQKIRVEDTIRDRGDFVQEMIDRDEMERRAQAVRQCMDLLPPRERRVLTDNIMYGKTLRSISKELGVHESRAAQLKRQGIRRMRGYLEGAVN